MFICHLLRLNNNDVYSQSFGCCGVYTSVLEPEEQQSAHSILIALVKQSIATVPAVVCTVTILRHNQLKYTVNCNNASDEDNPTCHISCENFSRFCEKKSCNIFKKVTRNFPSEVMMDYVTSVFSESCSGRTSSLRGRRASHTGSSRYAPVWIWQPRKN